MIHDLEKAMQDVAHDVAMAENGVWDRPSRFQFIKRLSNNGKGRFGERLFDLAIDSTYSECKDGAPGEWDLKLDDMLFEVKTATVGSSSRTFQMEGLQEHANVTGFLFLLVEPNDIYIKFIKRSDIPFEKLHNRRDANTGKGHKLTLTFKTKDNLSKVGKRIESLSDIQEEFDKIFRS